MNWLCSIAIPARRAADGTGSRSTRRRCRRAALPAGPLRSWLSPNELWLMVAVARLEERIAAQRPIHQCRRGRGAARAPVPPIVLLPTNVLSLTVRTAAPSTAKPALIMAPPLALPPRLPAARCPGRAASSDGLIVDEGTVFDGQDAGVDLAAVVPDGPAERVAAVGRPGDRAGWR